MDREDEDEDEAVNAIGPGAQSLDLNVDEPVSGMPAGGPHDLGRKAALDQQDPDDRA